MSLEERKQRGSFAEEASIPIKTLADRGSRRSWREVDLAIRDGSSPSPRPAPVEQVLVSEHEPAILSYAADDRRAAMEANEAISRNARSRWKRFTKHEVGGPKAQRLAAELFFARSLELSLFASMH